MSEEIKNEELEKEEESCCHHDHKDHEHHHEHEHEGHGHHHDHGDEECCHEHEGSSHHHHDHEEHEHHHHDHDDDCCGHDHDHEHHHDHGHTYEVAGYKLVETHVHEGATVCSFEKNSAMSAQEGKAAMQQSIEELESWLNETGALIGHVKGYIKGGGTTTTFSTVGNAQGLNISEHESAGLAIGFASIVFGPSEEELESKVIEVFERLK